jgi:hypothetical protein
MEDIQTGVEKASAKITRREFTSTLLSAAAVTSFGGTAKKADNLIWADLLHFGTNMWGDDGLTPGVHSYGGKKPSPIRNTLNFNETVWRNITNELAKAGGNMVVVDVGDAMRCPSCPEIALEDAWSPERLNAEVRRLKGLGLEPIPKLNFATTHDQWLKKYNRMIGTKAYYKCVSGVIRDVAEVFEKPRFFHLGMDEEDYDQSWGFKGLGIFRRGTAWWNDLAFYTKCCEKAGSRAWIFSDYFCSWPDDFIKNCPRSIVQSPWYYKTGFGKKPDSPKKGADRFWRKKLEASAKLADAGFDVIPCGSNFFDESSFGGFVDYCEQNVDRSRILGYMMAPWAFTLPGGTQTKNLSAIKSLAAARKAVEANRKEI